MSWRSFSKACVPPKASNTKNAVVTTKATQPTIKNRPSRASAPADKSRTVQAGSELLNGTGSGASKYAPDRAIKAPAIRRKTKWSLTKDSRGHDLSDEALTYVTAHELGHVLGLDDTGRYGDLMGPGQLDRPVNYPAPSERDALVGLQQEAQLDAQAFASPR